VSIASRRQIRSLGGSGDEDTGRGGGALARGDFSLLLSLYGRQRKKEYGTTHDQCIASDLDLASRIEAPLS